MPTFHRLATPSGAVVPQDYLCSHDYNEPSRKPLYHQAILDGKLKEGYACDDMAGLLFVNEKLKKSISLNTENNNYFILVENGKIKEELLPSEIIR